MDLSCYVVSEGMLKVGGMLYVLCMSAMLPVCSQYQCCRMLSLE
jgi:hypothetical protein